MEYDSKGETPVGENSQQQANQGENNATVRRGTEAQGSSSSGPITVSALLGGFPAGTQILTVLSRADIEGYSVARLIEGESHDPGLVVGVANIRPFEELDTVPGDGPP